GSGFGSGSAASTRQAFTPPAARTPITRTAATTPSGTGRRPDGTVFTVGISDPLRSWRDAGGRRRAQAGGRAGDGPAAGARFLPGCIRDGPTTSTRVCRPGGAARVHRDAGLLTPRATGPCRRRRVRPRAR